MLTDQLSFFEDAGQSGGPLKQYLEYRAQLFDAAESTFFLDNFINHAPWKQHTLKLYEKEVITPRLVAWYGDINPGSYLSEKISDISSWTPELLTIKHKVEALAGMEFNSVLLNYYRDGNDSVAWHSDKDSTPGKQTVVASVSFGQVRSFDIRNKHNHNEKHSIRLENGSYLLMKAGFQDDWEHRIAKSTKQMKARVNLTFRRIGI